ncbi:TauD/TfdA dioxygenase family protein [Yinghuangia sp. YIM S09857]|uniref:TauD/TfdA dioxygenase family protein n=1 Tax=Yinghuangia sp. YIM S09857 TaxID=3436929 RepID=UPI003F538D6C
MTAITDLEIRPMSGYIGAEIHGVDLTRPLAPDVVARIRAALLEWKVVFFRDQDISQARHIAFGRLFGEVSPGHPTLPSAFPDHPEILRIDNMKSTTDAVARSAPGDDEVQIETRWHTDVSYLADPPMGSILRAVVVPPYGGDTQFGNLALAYERLSAPVRDMIDHLTAVHENTLPIARGNGPSSYMRAFHGTGIRTVHPLVRVHPETGEKVLFVNPQYTSHIVELTRQEGRHLLALLYEHLASPEFFVRFRWEPNSIAFWDNRATVHRVPKDVPPGMHRSMQRITLEGDTPTGPHGFRSHTLSTD